MKDAVGRVQTMLVLGGASDIALAVSRALARDGTRRIALAVREPERAVRAAEELRGLGVTVDVLAFDADDTSSHEAFVQDAFGKLGDVDVVLLAFGVLGDQAHFEEDVDAAVALLQTNLVGAASLALRYGKRLAAQGHGTLVVLSSVAGERVRRANFVYGASKAGLDGLAQGLGDALHGTGARVLVVRPGFVRTKMTAGMKEPPLTVDADTVAEAVLKALQRGAETVWVPGAMRYVMTALRHVPRWAFRRLPI